MRTSPFLSVITLTLLLALGQPAQGVEVYQLARSGHGMIEEEVEALEAELDEQPDNLDARTRLLGYYFSRQHSDHNAAERRQQHILWLIEHRPEAEITSLPYASLDHPMAEAFDDAQRLWQDHVENNPENVAILTNAASFFTRSPRLDLAEQYYEKAKELEPDNGDWPAYLARVLKRQARQSPPDGSRELTSRALSEFERAYELRELPQRRFYLLNDLAETALSAGEHDKARDYAQQLLDQAQQFPNDWNHGNAIHGGHSVLGHLALEDDDVDAAIDHLLEAGNTPGSPQLNTFGPNMSLAQALLEAGERDAVLDYLDRIESFWANERGRLDQWREAIDDGHTPRLQHR